MSDSMRKRLNVAAVVLKCLAIAAILRPVVVHHAAKVVRVFARSFPGTTAGLDHARSYTYVSGFQLLSFSDIKWAVALGVVLYIAALALQYVAASRPAAPGPAPDRVS